MGKVMCKHLDLYRPHTPEQRAAKLQWIFDRCETTESGCREWRFYKNRKGYGNTIYQGLHWAAHRLAYVLAIGPLPPDMFVCHKCDNPACCEPSHFFLGDHVANQQDMIQKRRHFRSKRLVCKRFGHPLSGDNLSLRGPGNRHRHCLLCEKIRGRIRLGWTLEEATSLGNVPPGMTRHELKQSHQGSAK